MAGRRMRRWDSGEMRRRGETRFGAAESRDQPSRTWCGGTAAPSCRPSPERSILASERIRSPQTRRGGTSERRPLSAAAAVRMLSFAACISQEFPQYCLYKKILACSPIVWRLFPLTSPFWFAGGPVCGSARHLGRKRRRCRPERDSLDFFPFFQNSISL